MNLIMIHISPAGTVSALVPYKRFVAANIPPRARIVRPQRRTRRTAYAPPVLPLRHLEFVRAVAEKLCGQLHRS